MEEKHMSKWGVCPKFVIPSVILSIGSIIIYQFVFIDLKATGVVKFIFFIIGILCIILGAYLWLSSAFKIDKFIKKEELYQDGIYAIVRHPIYSGIWFVLSGIVLLFHSYMLLLIPIITYIYLTCLIKREENVLINYFGDNYLNYKKRVNAIIPTLYKRKI